MDPYENHRDEWREEENMLRYEREQAQNCNLYNPYDQDFIVPEDEEDEEDAE